MNGFFYVKIIIPLIFFHSRRTFTLWISWLNSTESFLYLLPILIY